MVQAKKFFRGLQGGSIHVLSCMGNYEQNVLRRSLRRYDCNFIPYELGRMAPNHKLRHIVHRRRIRSDLQSRKVNEGRGQDWMVPEQQLQSRYVLLLYTSPGNVKGFLYTYQAKM